MMTRLETVEFMKCIIEKSIDGVEEKIGDDSLFIDKCKQSIEFLNSIKNMTVYLVESKTSFDSYEYFNVVGAFQDEEKAKLVLQEFVKNSDFFSEAKFPEIGNEYAATSNRNSWGEEREVVRIEEFKVE